MNELNEVKTDIALIKRDIAQIEKFFVKLDNSIDAITSISKTIAIQERIVENHEKRLDDIDAKITQHHKEEEEFRKKLQEQLSDINKANQVYIDEMKAVSTAEREKRHKEVMSSIANIRDELIKKNEEQNKRISAIEQWKWWSMGVGAAIVTIGTLIWKTLFS
jgi:septal ring factor EnvC (AmiA/AmiB activator)